jgi:hypothetical protein
LLDASGGCDRHAARARPSVDVPFTMPMSTAATCATAGGQNGVLRAFVPGPSGSRQHDRADGGIALAGRVAATGAPFLSCSVILPEHVAAIYHLPVVKDVVAVASLQGS